MVNEELSRSQLIDARRRRIAWHEIARAIETLQAWRSYDDRGLSWIAHAAEVSGYTPTALREMLRTYNYSVEISKKSDLSLDLVVALIPLYALEIISRIHNIDVNQAIIITKKYVTSKMTVAELKSTYQSIKTDSSKRISNAVVGRKVSNDFEMSCFHALVRPDNPIIANMHRNYPGYADSAPKLMRWMSKSTRFSPAFAIEERNKEGKIGISAADYAIIRGWSEDRVVQRLIYLNFVSESFNRFWLIVPSWSSKDFVVKLMQHLGINQIGLVSVNPDDLDMRMHTVADFRTELKRQSLIDARRLANDLTKGIPLILNKTLDEEVDTHDESLSGFIP